MFKMIDLCAGSGAFSLAFKNAGVEVVYSNDFNKASKIIYDENFEHKLSYGDLQEVDDKDIPSHDILTAGIPCQPFSISGKQKGFDDERSHIFYKIVSIIHCHRPACIILENVKNILSNNKGKSFQKIKGMLRMKDTR